MFIEIINYVYYKHWYSIIKEKNPFCWRCFFELEAIDSVLWEPTNRSIQIIDNLTRIMNYELWICQQKYALHPVFWWWSVVDGDFFWWVFGFRFSFLFFASYFFILLLLLAKFANSTQRLRLLSFNGGDTVFLFYKSICSFWSPKKKKKQVHWSVVIFQYQEKLNFYLNY